MNCRAVLITLALMLPPAATLAASTELRAGANGHFVATADINGTPLGVLIDTGATTVALSYEDAQAAGLRPANLDYTVPVATANGVIQAARVAIRRIGIDNIRLEDVEGLVLPEGAMSGTLLGMSFLSRLRSFKIENGVLFLRN